MNSDRSRYPDEYPNETPTQPPDGLQTARPVRVAVKLPARRPWVSYTLIGLSVILFLLQLFSESVFGLDYLLVIGAKINEFIYAGEFWRLLTPMFLHGSILHLAFNMYALFIIGPGLERHYGHLRFLLLYAIAGLAGNVASFLLTPAPSLGASTAIFGLIAAQGIFVYKNRFLFGGRYQKMLMNIGMIVLFNLIMGMNPGIDNWGHMGGLIGGLGFAWFSGPILKVSQASGGFHLDDQRDDSTAWRTLLVEGFVISVFVVLKFMMR